MEKKNSRVWEYYNGYKISPKFIDKLYDNEIIIVGTNESGIHGAGAALQAWQHFGAQTGQGFGPAGLKTFGTFAIPTKDWKVQTLPLETIKFYVTRFIHFAKHKPNLKFLVTEIGCGLAGYTPEDIAPMFKTALYLDNVVLPESFIKVLEDRFDPV